MVRVNKEEKEEITMKPVRHDYDENDLLDDLIDELESLQKLNHRGYEFDITTYHLETGDVDGLQNVVTHLNASKPSHTKIKLIAVRTGQ